MNQTTRKSINHRHQTTSEPAPTRRFHSSAGVHRTGFFLAAAVIITLFTGCLEELEKIIGHEVPTPASEPGVLVDFLGNPFFPDKFWTVAPPQSHNVNIETLDQAVEMIASSGFEIYSFLVAVDGKLVFERYGWSTGTNPDDPVKTPHQVTPFERVALQSTTKSFTSTLIGIAINEGLISGVHDPIVPYFPEYQPLENSSPEKDAITLEDVLTMRSGLQYNGDNNEHAILYANDPARALLSRPVTDIPVGTVWKYNSASSDVLAALLRKVTGKKPLTYANQKLFGPLGIKDVYWLASENGTNHGGWGLELSTREMAKFGELYRNYGVWNGEQIVPADWTDSATAARCTTHNGDYGYQFWIPIYPGFFCTRGAYGRHIYVCRELGLVVVFTANLPSNAGGIFDNIICNYVVPAAKNLPPNETPEYGMVTLNITDIDASYNGAQALVSIQPASAACSSAPDDILYLSSGIITNGECSIFFPLIENDSYTMCAFIDADSNLQPSPGDLATQLSLVVSGTTTNLTESALGWLEL